MKLASSPTMLAALLAAFAVEEQRHSDDKRNGVATLAYNATTAVTALQALAIEDATRPCLLFAATVHARTIGASATDGPDGIAFWFSAANREIKVLV